MKMIFLMRVFSWQEKLKEETEHETIEALHYDESKRENTHLYIGKDRADDGKTNKLIY